MEAGARHSRKALQFPISLGIEPDNVGPAVSAVSYTTRTFRFTSSPISTGISPSKGLPNKRKNSKKQSREKREKEQVCNLKNNETRAKESTGSLLNQKDK